jgi:uncharacterized protein involved in exopolysaccharide biosynthesis
LNFNLLFFVRLFFRHIALLLIVPIVLAFLVFYFTKNQPKTYSSKTRIYTGIASGSSIEVLENQRFDFFATNTAFDNLINIIKARNTLEETGLQLFVQHMIIDGPDPKIISVEKYQQLMEIVPDSIKVLVVKGEHQKTLNNFQKVKNSNHENFIYKLLNLKHPDYSADNLLEKIVVKRISNSDLVEITYTSEDPGICQNTLNILCDVFVRSYADMKVNQSDAVVKYFNQQLVVSSERLAEAEDELLEFNRSNNIINYYEQTKHIASQKEHFEMEYQTVQMNNEAAKSVIKVLESRMSSRQKLQLASQDVLETRNKISEINIKIAMKSLNLQLDSLATVKAGKELAELQLQAEKLNEELRQALDTLYWVDNSIEGMPTNTILEDWLKNIIAYEGTNAQLIVLEQKKLEFRELYTLFAPLGATMKRLERKIDVAEKEYLSLLHSLSLAKLKQQNIELTSNLKMVDIPYFPIMPEPSKRKILVAVAGVMGFILVAFFILIFEFLDQNIKTSPRAQERTGLKVAAIFPKLSSKNKNIDYHYLQERAIDAIVRNVIFTSEIYKNQGNSSLNFFISTQNEEGKSFISSQLAKKLEVLGYKVLLLNYNVIEKNQVKHFESFPYKIDNQFYLISKISELSPELDDDIVGKYDFVFVEIPNIINSAFPVRLMEKSDHIYLVCRANRPWTEADQNNLTKFREIIKEPEPVVILNGVEIQEMETFLGDLPRRRSFLRRVVKNILRLRFFSKNNIAS